MRTQPIFDSWDCTPPILPPRSRLYAIEPLGIGTPFVESLSGYVARLADAHAVSVGNLVVRELSALVSAPLFQSSQPDRFPRRFYAINGLGEPAKKWVEALQVGTMRVDLRFLTLLPFEDLLWELATFRLRRAWCSACYEDDRASGKPVHERLIWALRAVTVCPLHRRPLEEVCPHCCQRSKPFTVYSRPGYCFRCQTWLGGYNLEGNRPDLNQDHTDAELWYAGEVGALLCAAPRLDSTSLRNTFTANFRACVDCVAEGNKSAFADAAKVLVETVRTLLDGNCQPQISTLLRISYHLGIHATTFFERDLARALPSWREAKGRIRIARLPSRRNPEKITAELRRAASEQPPPRLCDVARRLDYVKPDRLYRVDWKLCRRINSNYQDAIRGPRGKPSDKQFCSSARVQRELEASLAQELPTSPYHVALELGFVDARSLIRKFPSLCRAIQEKIDKQKALGVAAMECALTVALTEDSPPSLEELCERLGCCRASVLRTHFSTLCDRLVEHRRAYRVHRIEKLRQQLHEFSLVSPAVSLEQARKRVGFSRQQIIRLCPEECAAIVAHFDRSSRESTQRKVEGLHHQVRQIVIGLHQEGKCPSFKRVHQALRGKSVSQSWSETAAAVRAARAELNNRSPDSRESVSKDSPVESR